MGNSQGRPVVYPNEVRLEHFKLLRVVGKGAFGKVRIVERRDNGDTFALKYIRKDEVVRAENVRNMIRERKLLEHLNHVFLCNLRYCFQDYDYIYLIVDLMTGGDLRFHITRKSFTEDAVRFWMAELGCALRYIHEQGVIHRDVKPDNVLLDAEGHVHLADFNVATEYSSDKPLTSKSGTLAYLAPEIYEGTGYGPAVDWWSLGVVFYECIYHKRPIEANYHVELSHKIRYSPIKYPPTVPSLQSSCTNAMKALMERNPKERLGAISFESFCDHPFFYPIDFDALEQKRIPPVFRPREDKTNFDATHDLEELLLEEAPLEARTKNQKPRRELRAGASAQEHRDAELYKMIEKLFEPFDYTTATYEAVIGGAITLDHTSDSSSSSLAVDLLRRGVSPHRSCSPGIGEPPIPAPLNIRPIAKPGRDQAYTAPPSPREWRSPAPPSPSSIPERPRFTERSSSANYAYDKPDLRRPTREEECAIGESPPREVEVVFEKKKKKLGFLSSSKARQPSGEKVSKNQQPPGVLGKIGARQIVST